MTLEQHLGKKAHLEEMPTYEEAKAMLVSLYEKLGPIDARQVLSQFTVVRLSEMEPKYYGLFIDKCKAAINHKI